MTYDKLREVTKGVPRVFAIVIDSTIDAMEDKGIDADLAADIIELTTIKMEAKA
jgi:hypothetical protein